MAANILCRPLMPGSIKQNPINTANSINSSGKNIGSSNTGVFLSGKKNGNSPTSIWLGSLFIFSLIYFFLYFYFVNFVFFVFLVSNFSRIWNCDFFTYLYRIHHIILGQFPNITWFFGTKLPYHVLGGIVPWFNQKI